MNFFTKLFHSRDKPTNPKGTGFASQMVQNLEGMFHRCSLRAELCVHVAADQGTDEAGLGAENRPRRASRPPMEHGQHLHPHRPCREHQGRQGKKHGED